MNANAQNYRHSFFFRFVSFLLSSYAWNANHSYRFHIPIRFQFVAAHETLCNSSFIKYWKCISLTLPWISPWNNVKTEFTVFLLTRHDFNVQLLRSIRNISLFSLFSLHLDRNFRITCQCLCNLSLHGSLCTLHLLTIHCQLLSFPV